MRPLFRYATGLIAGLSMVALLAVPAFAHPLGNFTINHFSEVQVAGNVIRVAAVFDFAEIPTFQEKQAEADDPVQARRLVDGLAGGLHLTVDGAAVPLRLTASRVRFLPGQAGLDTMRLELTLLSPTLAPNPHAAVFTDTTYPGHLGWRELVVDTAGGARLTASDVPRTSISQRLTRYPSGLLNSPLAVRTAHFDVVPGATTTADGGFADTAATGFRTIQDRFSALIAARDLTPAALALSFLVALILGALHALEPGHGKAIMAGYLVATKGRRRDAAVLGLTITATHTAGVFALGLITLSASAFVTPERLYPVLNLASGAIVLAVGAILLRRLYRTWRGRAGQDHHHGPGGHTHPHGDHEHDHPSGTRLGRLGIIGVGISGGLIPCPSALVVLLAALSLHRVLLGMALIVAFSAGLALVLTGIGMALASSRGLLGRATRARSWRTAGSRVAAAVPALSALVVTVVGLGLTAQAFQTLR